MKTESYVFIGAFWWKKFFDLKTSLFNIFETLRNYLSDFVGNFQAGFWHFHSTCPKELSWGRNFFQKTFLNLLRQRSKNFRTSSNIFRRECQNCLQGVLSNTLTKTSFFWWLYKFCRYRSLSGTFIEFCRKRIDEFVKTAIYVSIRLSWWKRNSLEMFSVSLSFSYIE